MNQKKRERLLKLREFVKKADDTCKHDKWKDEKKRKK